MFKRGLEPPDPFREREILARFMTQDGMSLSAMAAMGSVLVVLLPEIDRCDRWLAAVKAARPGIEAAGIRLALVHPGAEDEALAALARHELQYLARVADSDRDLYRHFELSQVKRMLGGFRQLPGLVWITRSEIEAVVRPTRDDRPPPMGPNATNATN